MSDDKDNKPDSSEREDAAPGLADAAAINRPSRRKGTRMQTYVVVGLLACAVGYVGYSMMKQNNLSSSRISRGPNVDGTPAGQQQATPNAISSRSIPLIRKALKPLRTAVQASLPRLTNPCATSMKSATL